VLAIDVDRFKTVNDQFGHAAGDRALLHVVDLVKQAMRSSDMIGRTGGDEFLVLLPETGLEQAQVAADRLCALIRSQPLLLDGTSLKLTVSVGIAEASLSMNGIDVMLQMADSALYAAKANGRDGSAVRMPMEETQRLAAQ
jgi:diguanylate cyclase (GGDEF)-like protein